MKFLSGIFFFVILKDLFDCSIVISYENIDNFFPHILQLSKECNNLRKEKESIVIRYANSEKDVIMEKKAQQELEKKMKDMIKERENLISKNKGLLSENNRLTTCYETKVQLL